MSDVIVIEGLKAGTEMLGVVTENDTTTKAKANHDIPIGHKVALVDLKKGDALYLNDGSYGSLFDATHSRWPFPTKLVRDGGSTAELKPFRFYGPTCDSIDHMPGPFWLPADVQEGDFIEIGMLGAYGVAMSTGFNGFGDTTTVECADAPWQSMFVAAACGARVSKHDNRGVSSKSGSADVLEQIGRAHV